MPSITSLTPTALRNFQEEAGRAVRAAPTVEAGARVFLERLWPLLGEEAVLARVYLAVAASALGDEDRLRAAKLAAEGGEELTARSPVLTLFATRGVQPAWNARAQSQRHRAVPLSSEAALRARMPWVVGLLEQTGAGSTAQQMAQWNPDVSAEIKPGNAAMLFLADARTAHDGQGRVQCASRDFVEQHKVRSVVGSAGQYLGGTFVTLVAFLREAVDERAAQRMVPLLGTFRAATTAHFVRGDLFDP